MGSRTRTSTATKKEILRKRKAALDRLSTREAQVLRMRHGITEPPSSPVARPPKKTDAELRKRVRAVEDEILERVLEGRTGETDKADKAEETDADAKSKIIRTLKDKD